MILSVSRRTDIPAFYSEWFINRIREGFVMVRNPMNYNQVSRISLLPDVVDFIVFWSKNPRPLVKFIDEIEEKYPFYFQYTINAYGKEIEPNLPALEDRIDTFIEISKIYGKQKVIWRYDPILLTDEYSEEWHIEKFNYIASKLKTYTDTCVFSYVDLYDKVKHNLKQIPVVPFSYEKMTHIAEGISKISADNKIRLNTCSETIDYNNLGIGHSCCIDKHRIEEIIGCDIKAKKDSNQRPECGCMESVDIGQYNTCLHGCRYCYANYSQTTVEKANSKHLPLSPLLVGELTDADRVNERTVRSIKETQISLF